MSGAKVGGGDFSSAWQWVLQFSGQERIYNIFIILDLSSSSSIFADAVSCIEMDGKRFLLLAVTHLPCSPVNNDWEFTA